MRDPLAELEAAWAQEDAARAQAERAEAALSEAQDGTRGRDMDPGDRPRERLLRVGAAALSNAELLAILLGSGRSGENALEIARRLLEDRGLVGLLRADVHELMRERGLGGANVTRVKAAVELAARGLADDAWPAREPLRSSQQVYERYRPLLGDLVHEEVWVLVLDQQHCLIREERLYKGMVHGALVRVAELLRPVIVHQGPAMIVVHNHPSGSVAPSRADREMTVDLQAAAVTMGIELLDHVIVGRAAFGSMAQLGLLGGTAQRALVAGDGGSARRSKRSAAEGGRD